LASLSGGINAAVGAELSLAGHKHASLDLEVGVSIKVRKVLKLWDGILEPGGNGLIGTSRSELSKPDGLSAASLVGSLEMVEESATVLNLGVPVDVAEVIVALLVELLALGDPALEPLNTLARKTTVADGRGTNEGLSSIWVEPLDMGRGSVGRSHVSLASVVGLVEAEDSLGAITQGLGTVVGKAVGVERLVVPEGRDEVETLGKTVRRGVPVVTPAAFLAVAGESVGKFNVVVADTTLVGEASGATRRGAARLGLGAARLGLGLSLLLDGSLLRSLGGGLLLLGLGSGLIGRLGSLRGLGDLDNGGRLSSSRRGRGRRRCLGLRSGSGLGSSGGRTAGAEVVVLPRDDLTVNGSNDPVTTLLGVLVVSVAVAESESRLKKSGGSGKDGELVGDHLG
jgi:hypothetical protein